MLSIWLSLPLKRAIVTTKLISRKGYPEVRHYYLPEDTLLSSLCIGIFFTTVTA